MPIDTLCPGCQKKLRIGDEFAGKQARCPVCDTVYDVPAVAEVGRASQPVPVASEVSVAAETLPRNDDIQPSPASNGDEGMGWKPVLREEKAAPLVELPPADGTHWYLRTPEGPIYGPTTEVEFYRWLNEGRVTSDCHVSAGDNRWQPAGRRFPELVGSQPLPVFTIPESVWRPRYKPHRGPLILTLGIIGIVTSTFIPSIMAWVLGTHDLAEMDAERMDAAGRGLTQAGRFLGMVYSLLLIGLLIMGMFVLLLLTTR